MQWFRNLQRAVTSLLIVAVGFAVYQLTVVPLVEPATAERTPVWDTDAPSRVSSIEPYTQELAALFPAGSWELDNPRVLRGDRATIVFKELNKLDDGSLHVVPCTLVFYGSKRKLGADQSAGDALRNQRGPTILQTREGAILRFEKPVDIARMEFGGKPIGGSLEGDIRIFSAGGPDSDDFEMVTRDVTISGRRIRTSAEVQFRLGNNYGAGRELTISRAYEDEDEPPVDGQQDDELLADLGLVTLRHLDRLTVRVDGNKMFSSLGGMNSFGLASRLTGGARKPAKPAAPSTVEVRCDGQLMLDLVRLKATVEENVTIQHQAAGAKPDIVRASQLTMHLARVLPPEPAQPTESTEPAQQAANEDTGAAANQQLAESGNASTEQADAQSAAQPPAKQRAPSPKLELTRLVALGSPLIIDAQSQRAYIESKRFEYNFRTGKLRLYGFDPTRQRPSEKTQVRMQNADHYLAAPLLEVVATKDRREFQMQATGPGEYQGRQPGEEQMLVAQWQQGFRLTPNRGQHLLEILGQASVTAPGMGQINSDAVEVWLRHVAKPVQQPDGTFAMKDTVEPAQLTTRSTVGRRVNVASPQLTGQLSGLTVLFQSGDQANPADGGGGSSGGVFSRAGFSPGGSASPIAGAVAGRRADSASKNPLAKLKDRYSVQGGQLTAWVNTQTESVERVLLSGQSRVVQQVPPGQVPTELTGTTIDFQVDAEGRSVAVLTGSPARLKTAELNLSGEHVEYQADRNRVHMRGPGKIRLPLEMDLFAALDTQTGASATQAAGGNAGAANRRVSPISGLNTKPKTKQYVDVQWQDGLIFNGRMIQLQGKVLAATEDANVRTGKLSLILDRVVDLAKLQQAGNAEPPAKVLRISADGGVFAAHRGRAKDGTPNSLHQIATHDLEVDYVSGDTVARGPGWFSVTGFGNLDMLSGSDQPTGATGGSAQQAKKPRQLTHLNVAFARQLTANVHRRELKFDDDIRAWYGPVDDWNARVDPVSADELRKTDFRMSCHELLIFESPTAARQQGQRAPIELIAQGETVVEGLLFWGKGEQIKYAEDKGMLTMAGAPNRPAELWRRSSVGGPANSDGQFGEIRYWPKTRAIQGSRLPKINISAQPSGLR